LLLEIVLDLADAARNKLTEIAL